MPISRVLRTCLLLSFALVLTVWAFAQSAGPQPAPTPPQISAPKDTPYPGTIRLAVDASDVQRHVFDIRETIPVRGGEPLSAGSAGNKAGSIGGPPGAGATGV